MNTPTFLLTKVKACDLSSTNDGVGSFYNGTKFSTNKPTIGVGINHLYSILGRWKNSNNDCGCDYELVILEGE